MSIFLDAIAHLGSATINIPIAYLANPGLNLYSTVGIAIPAVSTSHLAKIGLFDHKVAEKITKGLLESAGSTLTGQWMDQGRYFPGVASPWHRMYRHHFLTDAVKVWQDPNLSVVDFYKHLATDVVTKNGLPILPEETIRSLANVLGITPTKIMPWVSFNILDIGASVTAVAHSGSNLISVIGGSAEWSLGYAANTFGVGAAKIVSGIFSENPVILASGAVDIACGTITAYDYYTQPFICGVPVSEILNHAALGASFGSIIALAEIFLTRKSTSKLEKLKIISEKVGTSTVLSSMSAISVPLGITTSFGLIGVQLARQASEKTNDSVRAIPIQAGVAEKIDRIIAEKHIGAKETDRLLGYINPEKRVISNIEQKMLSFLK